MAVPVVLIAGMLSIDTPPVVAAAPEPAIVVTGRRSIDPAMARSTVRSIGRPARIGGGNFQMARWLDPVCPVVLSTDADEASAMAQHIKAVAAEVGAPVSKGDCDRNIEVVITGATRPAMLDVQSREPGFLRGIAKTDIANMIDGTAPIRWGSVTRAYGADGSPLRSDGSVHGGDASRTHADVQTGLYRMIILVDRDRVADLPAEAVQDYVAMVALAQINARSLPQGVDTILADGAIDVTEKGLRRFDLAYLRALYSIGPNLYGEVQQSDMARRIADLMK